jgi:hypothetical protein
VGEASEWLEGRKNAQKQKAGKSKDGKAGGRGRRKENLRESCPEVLGQPKQDESQRTTSKAAEAAGLSRKTYEKAKAVVEAAEQDPQLFGDLPAQMDATGVPGRAAERIMSRTM